MQRDPAPVLDFWFEFASTYSYPAAMVVEDRAKQAGVSVNWQPFLLGPIFQAFGWDDSPFNLHPVKGRYMWRDMERICAGLDLPLQRPQPFPQNSVMAARIALIALRHDWGPAFCRAVYRAAFAESGQLNDFGLLTDLVTRVGGDAQDIAAQLEDATEKTRLRAQVQRAQQLGMFGAPSFVVEEEIYWGLDRLDMALDHARAGAVRQRAVTAGD